MRNILILTLAAALTGCGGYAERSDQKKQDLSNSSDVTDDFERSRLIAADFVATLSQIPETNPGTTVLHTSKPTSRFGELLLSALQGAGFDLRLGDNSSSTWLSYNANRDAQPTIDNNPVYTFILGAGDVKLKRSYEVDEFGVKPTGSMFVRGASATNLVMDDSIFNADRPAAQEQTDSIKEIAKSETSNSKINRESLADESKVTQRIELSAVPTTKPIEATQKSTPEFSTDENWAVVSNLYDTRKSKYEDIFTSYDVLDSSVLVFANDSLVLGKQNKSAIALIAAEFNPQTDVMSVIGCSHGSSKIKNGNAYLASNRAIRVKNEFVAVGLNQELVYEEGCWASVHFPKLPPRGVLVQHRRIKG